VILASVLASQLVSLVDDPAAEPPAGRPNAGSHMYDIDYIYIRYLDTRRYFNMRSEADTSQLYLPHGTNN